MIDRSTHNNEMLKGQEVSAWEQVKLTFGIKDFFDYFHGPIYTWDDCHMDEARILSRLDRFYSYSNDDGTSPCKEHINIGGAIGSDHLLVYFFNLTWRTSTKEKTFIR